MYAAGVLIVGKDSEENSGQILAVSCPDRKRKIGIPFGKKGKDETLPDCAIRECLEETGYIVEIINDHEYFYEKDSNGVHSFTYQAVIVGYDYNWKPGREGVPIWADPEELYKGEFGKYNKRMLRFFGIIDLSEQTREEYWREISDGLLDKTLYNMDWKYAYQLGAKAMYDKLVKMLPLTESLSDDSERFLPWILDDAYYEIFEMDPHQRSGLQ